MDRKVVVTQFSSLFFGGKKELKEKVEETHWREWKKKGKHLILISKKKVSYATKSLIKSVKFCVSQKT